MAAAQVHPNMSKVLSHYVDKGLVEVIPYRLAGFQPNGPPEFQRQFYFGYNDCIR